VIVSFTQRSLEEYQGWATEDRRIFKKIGDLIKEICRTPFEGNGKPEPLRHELSGFWSRRINQEHRLVYKVENDTVYIASCKYHYER